MLFVGSGWVKIKPEYVDSLSDEVMLSFTCFPSVEIFWSL